MVDLSPMKPAANPYTNPELAQWLSSFEGVPELQPLGPREGVEPGQTKRDAAMQWLARIAPGLLLAGVVTFTASLLAPWLNQLLVANLKGPVSPILLAIILGLVVGNVVSLPDAFAAGLKWCAKLVLRLGIVLLGLRLSLAAVGLIGLTALPLVLVCVTGALVLATVFGRWLRIPRRMASLIAVGTGICGVSAIVATAPSIDAEDDEISYAVACIALFGLVALFVYPFVAHSMFDGSAKAAGLFLGTAIHDTSQVAGAGLMYQQQHAAPEALEVAMVTKLLRNLSLIVVVPLMAAIYYRGNDAKTSDSSSTQDPLEKTAFAVWHRLTRHIPLFVVMFVAMAGLRSVGDLSARPFGVLPRGVWEHFLNQAAGLATVCLGLAMAAVGANTSIARLRRLGIRPLTVALLAAASVGLLSYLTIQLLGIPKT